MTGSREKLILEIHWNLNCFSMNIGARSAVAETVKQYTQCPASLTHIGAICREIFNSLEHAPAGKLSVDALQEFKKSCRLLWDQVLTPSVKMVLSHSACADLSLVIDEELSFIPWELLFDGKEFLCLKFNLGRLIATRAPQSMVSRRIGDTLKMLILVNPTNDLRNAYEEGVRIRRMLDTRAPRMVVDFKSTTIEKLYVTHSLREYDIVHFAGHCEYESADRLEAGWVLSDGILTGRDVMAMRGGLAFPALIFSNSCYSAQGVGMQESEEYAKKVYSLASAFILSGVRHYVGTFHKVEDSAGAIFSAEFYTRLFDKYSVGEACRRARLAIIRQRGVGTVAWAAYILYGDPAYEFSALPATYRVSAQRRVPPLPFAAGTPQRARWGKLLRRMRLLGLVCGVIVAGLLAVGARDRIALYYARSLRAQGSNDEAVGVCAQLVREGRTPQAHLVMADALVRLGRGDEAITHYFDYIVNFGRSAPRQAIDTYVKIGWVYQQTGEYAKAFECYTLAHAESRRQRDAYGESTALRKLALWYMDKGDNNKALELLTQSLEIDRSREALFRHKYNMACDYFDIGLVFVNKEEGETAKEFYGKSAALFAQMRLPAEESDYYANIGEIAMGEKQYSNAMDDFMKGLRIDIRYGDRPAIAADYGMIGELYAETAQEQKAQEYFRLALSLASQVHAKPTIASACYNLGLLYKKRGERDNAREYLGKAKELYQAMGLPEEQEASAQLKEIK